MVIDVATRTLYLATLGLLLWLVQKKIRNNSGQKGGGVRSRVLEITHHDDCFHEYEAST